MREAKNTERRELAATAVQAPGRSRGLGLRELLPGRLHAEPGVLPGRLLPAVIELLNGLMTGTPARTLSGVSLKD